MPLFLYRGFHLCVCQHFVLEYSVLPGDVEASAIAFYDIADGAESNAASLVIRLSCLGNTLLQIVILQISEHEQMVSSNRASKIRGSCCFIRVSRQILFYRQGCFFA